MINRRYILTALIVIIALVVAHEVNFAGHLIDAIKKIHGG